MNLKHLKYFWTVARTGSVIRAAERVHLTPQTVSAQIKLLEEALGVALFQPSGRGLELTDAGRMALSYADEILDLSNELVSSLALQRERPMAAFHVGITDVVPKSLAYRLLAPVAELEEPLPVRLVCREGQMDYLLAELALHRLDAIIADRPMPTGLNVRGHSHKLGECAVGIFAAPGLLSEAASFPACLNDMPFLLPGKGAAARGKLERWFAEARITPIIMGEFDDGALMKAFGQAGRGLFPAPVVLATELAGRYGVHLVGKIDAVREGYWLITGERRLTHPAVRAVADAAQGTIFA